MQKSVLVPIDKYERLTSKVKQVQDSWTQTESVFDIKDSEIPDHIEKREPPSEGIQRESAEKDKVLPSEKETRVREKETRGKRKKIGNSVPPGKRSIRSLWVSLNG